MSNQAQRNPINKFVLIMLLLLPATTASFWPFNKKHGGKTIGTQAVESLKRGGDQITDSLSYTATFVGDAASGAQQAAKERGSELADSVAGATKRAAEKTLQAGAKTQEKAMKTTTEASMAAASFVGDKAGQAQDVAKESLHNAAAKASKAGDAVSGKAGEAMNGIKDMAMSTGDKASSE